MNILLVFFSASAHSMNSISLRLYQSVYMFLAAVAYFVLNGFRLQLDGMGLFLALCYGLDLAMTVRWYLPATLAAPCPLPA